MLIQRYSNILRGQMTFTGNTLGFSRTPLYQTGIDVFLSTNSALSVPDYPTPSTLVWKENSSTAVLKIPSGSTIEYAELIWGGSSVGTVEIPPVTTIPISTLNTPITFIDALGSSHTITFDSITALENSAVSQIYYVRSKNVTSIVKSSGPGTYVVKGVPAVTNPSPSQTASAGWTLAVIYSNPSLPYRFLELYVGNDLALLNEPSIDKIISGFTTTSSGTHSGRLLLSAVQGESSIAGDYVSMGPTISTLVKLSGPNNLTNNFFTSTINNDLGVIDTSGSFGNLNQSPGSTNPGCRNAWDITNVNISSTLLNSQKQAIIRFGTTNDSYVLSTLGVQIDNAFFDISVTKSVNKSYALVGDTLTFISVIKNTGNEPIKNIIFTDNIPSGTTYTNPSVTINGTLYPLLNPNTPIDLGSLLPLSFPLQPNSSITIAYSVTINQTTSGTIISNTSSAQYEYVDGGVIKTSTKVSNTVSTTVFENLLSITKSVDRLVANLNESLTYKLTITNTGSITTENTIVKDNIPSGTVFIADSVTINGLSVSGLNPQNGINLGNISPSQTVVVSFKVTTTNVQVISNNATVDYIFIPSPGVTPISGNSKSNIVETVVAVAFECRAFGYKVSSVSSNSDSYFSEVNLLTGKQNIINSDLGLNVNAIGYNSIDNYIYGIAGGTNNLLILDAVGNVINLGSVSNLPIANYNVGAIDKDGHFFIYSALQSRYYVINVNETSPLFKKLVDPTAGFIEDTSPFGTHISSINIQDWTFNLTDGHLYSVQSNIGTVLRINPFSGVVTNLTTTGVAVGSAYGSIYSFSDKFIYATNNNTGEIFRIEINSNNAIGVVFSKDIPNNFNDGASCLDAQFLIDFGDTPTNYKTLLEDNGPRHTLLDKLTIGAQITSENNAYASSDALGDDKTLGIQDDGTILPLTNMALNASSYTITLTVFNDTGINANLYAWLDFNKDGIFQTDEGSSAVISTSAQPQNINLTFTRPSGVTLIHGNTFIRARLTLDNLINTGSDTTEDTRSYGPAGSGEVEDYLLIIEDTKIVSTKTVNKVFADLGETLTYTVTLNNPGTLPINNVLFTDTLPNGVTYANKLTVNVPFTGIDPMTGLTITTINSNQTVNISWDVKVKDTLPIPTPNPIQNSGIVSIPGLSSTNTNIVTTQIKNATLTVTKNTNKKTVLIGDTVTYSLQVVNNGNTVANQVFLTDVLPSGVTYVAGTLFVDGVFNSSNPSSGINLASINPSQTKIIVFNVTLNNNPASLPLENTAIIDYEYIVNPSNPPINQSDLSNMVSVDVANVSLVKSVDKPYEVVGNILTYTSVITNNGNLPIKNIIFTDNIPSKTTYVNPSITINGVLFPLINPNTPINLGSLIPLYFPLKPNESITVGYSVNVDDVPSGTIISNTSSVQFEYLDGSITKTSSKNSNEVTTTILQSKLEIIKSVDKVFSDIGEVLTYTLAITNIGSITTNNTIVIDDIPLGTIFVLNSVTINGVSIPGENPEDGILLGSILPSQTVTISFKVNAITVGVTPNDAIVNYIFIPSPGFLPLSDSVTSNTVTTIVANIFSCEPFGYKVVYVSEIAHSAFIKINLITGAQTIISDDLEVNANAIGYNIIDNFIYGIQGQTTNLLILDSLGNVINLGAVLNLPSIIPSYYNVGAIDKLGHLFIYSKLQNRYYVIDINVASPTFKQLVDPTNGFALDTIPFGTPISTLDIGDWAFRYTDNNLYSVQNNIGNVLRINPLTGVVTALTTTGVPSGSEYTTVYSISDGFIYATNNNTGKIYRIDINGNNATGVYFSQGISGNFSDGASCLNAKLEMDFGDSPSNYKTLLKDNGPRHAILNQLFIGTQVTAEKDAYASNDALGDDKILGIQDDGTSLPLVNMKTSESNYTLTVSVFNGTEVDANLYAWLDFNKDGIFQTNEGVTGIVTHSALPKNINLTFTVPSGTILTPGNTFIRVRLTTDNLINTGSISQEDTRSYGPASDGEVEDYLLIIEQTQIIAIKSVSKQFADLGETLTYSVTLKNPGTSVINNVIFTDPLPNGVTYENNLSVSTSYTGTDPMTGLTITTINPNQTVTISWDVKIGNTIPLQNPIVNTGIVSVLGEPNVNTNTVSTQVNNATLLVTKNTDKQTALIGENIVYTLQVTNSGNVVANPAILTDVLPPSTTYVPDTLFINGVFNPSNPSNGIDLSPINPGQTKNIIFSVIVNNNPSSLPLQNTAIIDYQYKVNPSTPSVSKNNLSNTIEVDVASVDITKSSNKPFALIGDTLTFTSIMINTGNAPIENIIFTDNIPTGTTYVNPSVNINGILFPLLNPNTPLNLITIVPGLFPLQPNTFITVAYTVTVDPAPLGTRVKNTSSMSFRYLDGTILKSSTENSNEVSLFVLDEEVDIIKFVDSQVVNLGEVITYTLIVANGKINDINSAIVTDNIPMGTVFVINSVTIDGVNAPGENPQLGIYLGTISSLQILTITFKVIATDTQVIGNYATLQYDSQTLLNANTVSALQLENVVSNTVSTISGRMFSCIPFAYRVASNSLVSNSSFTKVNLLTGEQTIITNDIGININAIGYNTLDNFIYGIENTTNNLIIIDLDGNVIDLGNITNLPLDDYNVGAIDNSGHMYIYSSLQSNYYVIDVDATSSTFKQLLDPSGGFIPDTPPFGTPISPINISDWAFNSIDKNLYTVENNIGNVFKINPLSGASSFLTTSGVPGGSDYSSIYSINDGFIYATNNTTGGIFRIEINKTTANGILFSNDIPNEFSDGASCINANLFIDFGDTPTSYKTLLEDNGPRHGIASNVSTSQFTTSDFKISQIISSNLTLGSQITSENNAYASNDALGDDQLLGVQDDGTTLPLTNMALNSSDYTITETVFNNTGVDANLYAWLDFNQDGIFETNEGISTVVSSSATPQVIDLMFTLPGGVTLTPGDTFIRVRLTTDNLINTGGATDEDTRSIGPVNDGEVEDYFLTIEDTQVVSTKFVDKSEVDLEESFTFTVTLSNPGTLAINDVLFVDPLPNGVTYTNNLSVSTSFTGTDPMTGLTITTINPGETVTISWDVRALDTIPNPNPIPNTATITIPGLLPTNTNTVTTEVRELSIHLTKNCEPNDISVGDIINYTFIIRNAGIIDATNIKLFDILDNNLSLVPNSFVGSTGGSVSSSDLVNGVDIGDLNSREQKEVSFSVILTDQPCPPITCNTASITYEYELIPGETLVGTSTSNECCNDILVTTFKQTFIDGNLSIPEGNPNIEILEDLTVTTQVINSVVIDSPEGISESGQSLTGKKLLTCINFLLTATYISPTGEEITQDFEISTCEYIVIPSDEGVTCSTPNVTIEDLYYDLIDPQKIFYNITYLIDTCC